MKIIAESPYSRPKTSLSMATHMLFFIFLNNFTPTKCLIHLLTQNDDKIITFLLMVNVRNFIENLVVLLRDIQDRLVYFGSAALTWFVTGVKAN